MPALIGAFEQARVDALRFRLRWRDTQRKGQAAVEAAGMPWETALALTYEIGVPGKSQASQDAWLVLAQASTVAKEANVGTIDWQAIIAALLANLPALLAICGG